MLDILLFLLIFLSFIQGIFKLLEIGLSFFKGAFIFFIVKLKAWVYQIKPKSKPATYEKMLTLSGQSQNLENVFF